MVRNMRKTYRGCLDSQVPSDKDADRCVYVRATRPGHRRRAQGWCSGNAPARHVDPRLVVLEGLGGYQRCCLTPKFVPAQRLLSSFLGNVPRARTHTLTAEGAVELMSNDAYDLSYSFRTMSFALSIQSSSHPASLKYLSLWRGCRTAM